MDKEALRKGMAEVKIHYLLFHTLKKINTKKTLLRLTLFNLLQASFSKRVYCARLQDSKRYWNNRKGIEKSRN